MSCAVIAWMLSACQCTDGVSNQLGSDDQADDGHDGGVLPRHPVVQLAQNPGGAVAHEEVDRDRRANPNGGDEDEHRQRYGLAERVGVGLRLGRLGDRLADGRLKTGDYAQLFAQIEGILQALAACDSLEERVAVLALQRDLSLLWCATPA